ncbi:SgcJ/EcaC family oxidoreductase [Nocardiopsis baichengensis]|uniref:SgcJ/EcaC family oxidoreductase n=1 Tax=Nocardiopsis baichengensis TaxID=280240 RepID=UPI00034D5DC7|nr:SgcJ/EcaC family oxidoreductase [Nocardiopsis baichengensis]
MAEGMLVAGEVAAEERQAATAVVKDLEEAFNAHDAAALSACFAAEASWTNAAGMRLDGREAIAGFGARAFQGPLRDAYARYEVVKLLAIVPGAVGVNVRQVPTDEADRTVDGHHGVATYVVAREQGAWRIVVGQNNAVAALPGG